MYPKFSEGAEHVFASFCKVSPFTRQMDAACSCSSVQTLLLALFGFFISAQWISKRQNPLHQRWTPAQGNHSSLVHSEPSKGQTEDHRCPKVVSTLFLGKEHLQEVCLWYPHQKNNLLIVTVVAAAQADIFCSRFLLSARRFFSTHHTYDEPSPCNQGLWRPRLRCAGQARATCAALAPLPEGTTCYCAPTHILSPRT